MTSRQTVDSVKKLIRPVKIGHSGTLDPLASGVLVLCLGPATRLASFVQEATKVYEAEFQLGVTSLSDDLECELTPVEGAPSVSEQQLADVLPRFVGSVSQVPPQYSAVKINGKRAYRLARQGQEVEISSRQVRIDRLEVLDFNYPRFRLRVECGGGTYIRSLGRDIGAALGSGAVMTELVRTRVGAFELSHAVSIEALDSRSIGKHLVAPLKAVEQYPCVTLNPPQIERLRNGGLFSANELGDSLPDRRMVAVDEDGQLVCIMSRHRHDQWRPELNFVHYYQSSVDS